MNIYANDGLFNADILEFDELTSPNSFIIANCEKLSAGTVACSLCQTKCDECSQKLWDAEFKASASFSVLLKSAFIDEPSIIPLLAGIAVCETLSKITGKRAFMKWPSEIILENKRVCEIVCQSKITPHTVYAVCGIGVNINTTQSYFDEHSFPYSTSLFLKTAKIFDEIGVIKSIVTEFEKIYLSYKMWGVDEIKPLHIRGCITRAKDFRVIINGETIIANIISVGKKGQLICLDDNSNQFEVYAGHISTNSFDI